MSTSDADSSVVATASSMHKMLGNQGDSYICEQTNVVPETVGELGIQTLDEISANIKGCKLVEEEEEDDDDSFESSVAEYTLSCRSRERRTSDVMDSLYSEHVMKLGTESRDEGVYTTPSKNSLESSDEHTRSGSVSDITYSSSAGSVPHSVEDLSPYLLNYPHRQRVSYADVTDAQPTSPELYSAALSAKETPMVVSKDATEYNMNHPRRGKAIILNHDTFEMGLSSRTGSEVDANNLQTVFKSLNFDVECLDNLTYSQIKGKISELSKEDHSDADCLIVTVLTHGMHDGYLYSFDVPYKVDMLWSPFTADKCSSLAGKPKIFFIQACRGEKLDAGVTLVEGRRRSRTEIDSNAAAYKIPSHADFLIVYSTVEGFYSWRNPEHGTWFIQALCQELAEKADTVDLLKLLTRTARRVALDFESYHDTKPWMNQQKQVPSITSMLIRDIFFRKKYHGASSHKS